MYIKQILEVLFPYIVLFYLVDCFKFIEAHHLVFNSYLGRTFSLWKDGLQVVGLLPLSETVAARKLPVCPAVNGLYILRSEHVNENRLYEEDNFDLVMYSDLSDIAVDGKNITVNEKHVIRTPSVYYARYITDVIKILKDMNAAERQARIAAFLADTMSPQDIKNLRKHQVKQLLVVKAVSSVLFLLTFVLLPVLLYTKLYSLVGLYILLACMIGSTIAVAVIVRAVYKKLYPVEKGHLINLMSSLVLMPVSAVHAAHFLTRDMYKQFDYLCIAGELMPVKQYLRLMKTELQRIKMAMILTKDKELAAFWQARSNALCSMLENEGIAVGKLLVAPLQQDRNAAAYCPICENEYRDGFDTCSDCNVKLEEYR